VKRRDLSGLDRNLELLAQEIALRGSRLFSRTTSTTCASGSISHEGGGPHFTTADDVRFGEGERIVIREWIVKDEEEVRIYTAASVPLRLELIKVEQGPGVRQYLAMRIAGTTVKHRTSHPDMVRRYFTQTRGSSSRCAYFLQATDGRWKTGEGSIRVGRMHLRPTLNRYHGRRLL
jgi:hypothetical protein